MPAADDPGVLRVAHGTPHRGIALVALVACAALIVAPVRAIAQPPVVQYDGQGRPLHRYQQSPDGTVQEDWRGRSEGTWTNGPTGFVFRDWRGIPIGK